MVSRTLDDEFIRFCVYQLTSSHQPAVHQCYHVCVDGQATPIPVKVAIVFNRKSGKPPEDLVILTIGCSERLVSAQHCKILWWHMIALWLIEYGDCKN